MKIIKKNKISKKNFLNSKRKCNHSKKNILNGGSGSKSGNYYVPNNTNNLFPTANNSNRNRNRKHNNTLYQAYPNQSQYLLDIVEKHFNNLSLKDNVKTELMQEFSKLFNNDPNFKELSLFGINIQDILKELATGLQTNNNVNSLILSSAKIDDTGATYIANALTFNTTLTYLFLPNNEIGDDGVKAIVNALESNNTLTSLDLQNNKKISDRGIEYIAISLETNKTLTSLLLSNVSSQGANSIAAALKINTKLMDLSISANTFLEYNTKNVQTIGLDGVKAIIDSMQFNDTLNSLKLGIIDISDADMNDMKNILDSLQINTSLTTLELYYKNKNKVTTPKEISIILKQNGELGEILNLKLSMNKILRIFKPEDYSNFFLDSFKKNVRGPKQKEMIYRPMISNKTFGSQIVSNLINDALTFKISEVFKREFFVIPGNLVKFNNFLK